MLLPHESDYNERRLIPIEKRIQRSRYKYGCCIFLCFSVFIRLLEPSIKEAAKEFVRHYFCCRHKRKVKIEASLSSFLNSSINIEYVYLILTGIEKVMRQRHYLVEMRNVLKAPEAQD